LKKLLPLLLFFVLFLSSLASAQANPQAAYCNIQYLDVADDLTLGLSDGAIMFRVQQERTNDDNTTWNYTITHASCYLNILKKDPWEQDSYDIISTEPYENVIPHGLRYSTTGGALNFLLDMNEEFWEPNTNYTWQVYCYCLDYNLTNGVQDQHDCWYGNNPFGISNYSGYPVTNTLGCTQSGSFVTGSDYRHTQTYSGGLAIVIFILLITGLVFFYPLLKDYLRQPLSDNEYLNLTYRRLCYILATYLMVLNSAILAQISVKSGILLHNEMFLYLRLFGITAQILIYYMIFKTVLDLLQTWKDSHKEKRGHE